MDIIERIVTGKLIKGKKMNEPYLTIWKSLLFIPATILFFMFIQFLSWMSEYINYVVWG